MVSRTKLPSNAVSWMQDRDARCVCRLSDLTNAPLIRPNVAYTEVGRVNAYKLYLVIDSARSHTTHSRRFTIPVPVDGAGGSAMG
jgi:hypothetical protein